MVSPVTLTTSDGIQLAGIYRRTDQRRVAILLHMMPSTKESWDSIAQKLLEHGVASLAIDMRGHGESTMGGTIVCETKRAECESEACTFPSEAKQTRVHTPWLATEENASKASSCGAVCRAVHTLDYKQFNEEQQQAKRLDLDATLDWANTQGFDESRTILIGASIGANLAIRALAEHPDLPLAIALSPGLNYRGVTTDDAIVKIRPNQKVILVASDDDRPSWDSVHELHRLNPSTILIERHNLGHGTYMTDKDPTLIQELMMYLLN